MKKKVIISIIITLILSIIILFIISNYKSYSNNKRYETIKMEIEEEAKRYLKVSHPYCTPGSESFTMNDVIVMI